MARGTLAVVFALCLLVDAFCLPANVLRFQRDTNDNWIDVEEPNSKESSSTSTSLATPDPFDDDDDDFSEPVSTSNGGGSSIFSLLNLATALFPSSSGSNTSPTSSAPPSPLWTLKMDIMRAILQFGTSLLGLASSTFSSASRS
ncbi:hypothetical protein O3G_MSEX014006 [Manduca sexta]|uniref:Uncharacterized protein n=1 Tax=Manduca sexta TaxID=7130 RepID=A0A921ZTM1_MANSE|nr:hypothetical protein O3G_MSEX014006 [Manduca sexta]KAG6463664.1 hypothetical protein O3G_MSEX014006 [Manduca sexta]KAG6463665.1 hypothetical protein O3G_MSEX014006 [Manduca sexta]